MKHTISVLVQNKFGVLARIAGLFSARGFNIDSLAVGETEDPSVSRMTIVVDAESEKILEQIQKQLHKLIDVISVTDLTKKDFIERELVLVKVTVEKAHKKKIDAILRKVDAHILHKGEGYVIIRVILDKPHMEKLLEGLAEFGIKELVRTGRIAIQE